MTALATSQPGQENKMLPVVNVTQIATIDRSRLVDRAGTLRRADLARVDDGLRLALHL
jgi:mRNA-degrading endonuclease toxin of MazEF toxin-antitoxin module